MLNLTIEINNHEYIYEIVYISINSFKMSLSNLLKTRYLRFNVVL